MAKKTKMKIQDIHETISSHNHITNKVNFLRQELDAIEKRRSYLVYEKNLADASIRRIATQAGKTVQINHYTPQGGLAVWISVVPELNWWVEKDINPHALKRLQTVTKRWMYFCEKIQIEDEKGSIMQKKLSKLEREAQRKGIKV